MISTIILTLAMLFSATPKPDAQDGLAFVLEPNYATLQLYGDGPRVYEPCNDWPIKPFQPRAFNMRGRIFNESADEVGGYFVRGWIRQSDGAHVADYALTFRSIGTIVFSLDALPDVDAAEIDGFVFSGSRRNTPFFMTFRPRRSTDCVWGLQWQGVLQIE